MAEAPFRGEAGREIRPTKPAPSGAATDFRHTFPPHEGRERRPFAKEATAQTAPRRSRPRTRETADEARTEWRHRIPPPLLPHEGREEPFCEGGDGQNGSVKEPAGELLQEVGGKIPPPLPPHEGRKGD